MHASHHGFTLVEVLVALAVFSFIGMGCWQVSNQVLRAKSQIEERSARLRELQRGFWVLSRDIHQAVDRSARDGAGVREPAMTSMVPGQTLTFTRGGWMNPLGERRSHLQRVAYGIERDAGATSSLVRYYWDVPDRSNNAERHRQILITNVAHLEFQFLDHDGGVHFYWPPRMDGAGWIVPTGIRMRIHVAPYGEIEKSFSLRNDGSLP